MKAKLHDYCKERANKEGRSQANEYHCAAAIFFPFVLAKMRGADTLEVTEDEYANLVACFERRLPHDWDGRYLWEMTLVIIKE